MKRCIRVISACMLVLSLSGCGSALLYQSELKKGKSRKDNSIEKLLLLLGLAGMFNCKGCFQSVANMSSVRAHHTATLLKNGKILITGGWTGSVLSNTGVLGSAEIYDPATKKFTSTGNMIYARKGHTATLMSDGRVLITGGWNGSVIATAEIYDPSSGTFVSTGNMTLAGSDHTATLLSTGKILVAGGTLLLANLYDSSLGLFTATSGSPTNLGFYSSIILQDGNVLLITGVWNSGTSQFDSKSEIYNTSTNSFSVPAGAMGNSGYYYYPLTAVRLNNGKVLIAGGDKGNNLGISRSEIYDSSMQSFSVSGSMVTGRYDHKAALLQNGKILVAGGSNMSGDLTTAELYDPALALFTETGAMASARAYHTLTNLPDGTVLVTGGYLNNTAEIYIS